MELPATLPLVYWGTKYLMAIFGIWLTFHYWIIGQQQKSRSSHYDDRPWLVRHPIAMMTLLVCVSFVILYILGNLKPLYVEPYYNLLVAGEWFLYSWYAVGLIVLSALIARVMYRNGATRFAGALTFGTVMLAGMMAPYYIYAIFS
ncbi:hypothetical protein H0W91_00225 [Patescibacteria group bacterium]|nr:hypothetical protein [Patescibacteria group bacterium]